MPSEQPIDDPCTPPSPRGRVQGCCEHEAAVAATRPAHRRCAHDDAAAACPAHPASAAAHLQRTHAHWRGHVHEASFMVHAANMVREGARSVAVLRSTLTDAGRSFCMYLLLGRVVAAALESGVS